MEVSVILVLIGIALVIMIIKMKNAKPEVGNSKSSTSYHTSTSTGFSDNKTQTNISKELSLAEIVKKSKFVAIDFETANSELSSACSLGLAFSDGEKVIATRHYYIKPTPNHFDQENIEIHGITPEMVKDAPTFFDLWRQIDDEAPMLETLDFVAHNAKFDANVLRQAYHASGTHSECHINGAIQFFCTLDLVRNAYDLGSNKLDEVCRYLGINFTNHHDASADAVAAAEIIHTMVKKGKMVCIKYSPLYDLADEYSYKPMEISQIRHMKPFGVAKKIKEYSKKRISADALASPDLDTIENKSTQFYSKKIVISGTFHNIGREELAQKLKSYGADIQSAVSSKTNFFIMGENPGWSKKEKVDKLMTEGCQIEIIDESTILDILKYLNESDNTQTSVAG